MIECEQFEQFGYYGKIPAVIKSFVENNALYAIKLDTEDLAYGAAKSSDWKNTEYEYIFVLHNNALEEYNDVLRSPKISDFIRRYSNGAVPCGDYDAWRISATAEQYITFPFIVETERNEKHTIWLLSGLSGYKKNEYRTFAKNNDFKRYQIKQQKMRSMNNMDTTIQLKIETQELFLRSLRGEIIQKDETQKILLCQRM